MSHCVLCCGSHEWVRKACFVISSFSLFLISWPWCQNTGILNILFGSAGSKRHFKCTWFAKWVFSLLLSAKVRLCLSLFSIQISTSLSHPVLNHKTRGQTSSLICAVAVWNHLVVLWLCGGGRGSRIVLKASSLAFVVSQAKTGPFPGLKSHNFNFDCEQNDKNEEKWEKRCYCWRVKDYTCAYCSLQTHIPNLRLSDFAHGIILFYVMKRMTLTSVIYTYPMEQMLWNYVCEPLW